MATETKPKRFYMELCSGRYLNLIDPSHEEVSLDDIALGLSHTCRWAGHCPFFYSVAAHACLVHDILAAWGEHELICLAGLHHDDHEAFIGDLATPVKTVIGDSYYRLADRLDVAIARSLDIDPDLFKTPRVKQADNLALFVEAAQFKPSQGLHWNDRPDDVRLPAGIELPRWTFAKAHGEFLLRAEK